MFKGLRNTLTLRPNIIYESRHSLVCDLPLLCCRLMVFSQLFYWHTEYNRRLRTRPLNISELPIIEYLDDVKGASKDVRSDFFLAKNISVLLDHNQTTLHNHLRATDYIDDPVINFSIQLANTFLLDDCIPRKFAIRYNSQMGGVSGYNWRLGVIPKD